MKTINLRVLYPDAYKSDYYVEVPDEVLEDQPHLLVRHRVRAQVHVAELGDDEIENVRLAQPTDLVLELEPAKTPHQFHEVV